MMYISLNQFTRTILTPYSFMAQYLPVSLRRLLRTFGDKLNVREHLVDQEDMSRMLNFYMANNIIQEDSLVFDIGANIGSYTSIFLLAGAKVVAAEPLPYCIDKLKKKYSEEPRFKLFEGGLGDMECYQDLHISGTTVASTFSLEHKEREQIQNKTDYTGSVRVKVTTLDYLINKFGIPSYIKIDVEGFEKQVLAGLSTKVKFLSFEYHLSSINDTIICLDRLHSIGFTSFNYYNPDTNNFGLLKWTCKDEILKAIKEAKLLTSDIYAR